ncbi:nuclear transport factor 2 family protein [Aureispira anguillae]|uniref:Nuclear transport factor 2 family protein n=1 Tax=Aureispira anguillae TaxID=2864201 RepID=A0A915YKU1_9BACT|nr:nuclear transport factor 2 family protein [Aureispira anguillae]BDS15059.1 nuclear transport factor 2 family protein [Aureispira anguillae]
MKTSPLKVVYAFGQGLQTGTDSWKEVVAENVTFTGPVDQVQGLEAFAKLNESFMPMVRGNEMKQAVEAGNFVITQILLDVAMPSGKLIQLDMSEWYEVIDGKIQSIKVYYDAEEFRKELQTS